MLSIFFKWRIDMG